MKDLRTIFHPRVAMFMIAIPFMTLCPLAISSILLGFPAEAWINNGTSESFQKAFEEIPMPDNTKNIGMTKTFFGALDNQNKCDIVSARIVTSALKLEDFSAKVQTNYQALTNVEDEEERSKGFKYLYDAGVESIGLKVLPVNPKENFIKADFESTNLKKDFQYSNNLSEEKDNIYLVYLGHLNAFSSRDYRCKK
jgi:hypothetical protein